MRAALVAGALAFAGLLACPQKPPEVPVYKSSLDELRPYFVAYLWVDENAIDDGFITRVSICRGNNGLENLAVQGVEHDEMKTATAFSLLTGTLQELTPMITEYVNHASNADCPQNDVDCLREEFYNILDDARFTTAICASEEAHNNYARQLLVKDVPATEPNATLLEQIRQARMSEAHGVLTQKPEGVFYLRVCE